MSVNEFEIRREALTSQVALTLITDLNGELSGLYPEPGATHFRLDADEVTEGRGLFLVAYAGEQAVGCGAFRRIETDTAELKRMYVAPETRGRGVGRMILQALEAGARQLEIRRLVLETGTRQIAAIGLYQSAGYVPIPPFGEYVHSADTSYCMAKELT